MIFIVHILSLAYAYFSARHDIPAVDNFTDYGSNNKHQSQFHSANWKMKLLFCLGISGMLFIAGQEWLVCVLLFISAGLDIWIVFDPVIALGRKNKQAWYYLSTGNKTDRALLKVFGPKAGIFKAIICISINIALALYIINNT